MFKDIFSSLNKGDERYTVDQDNNAHPFTVNVVNNYKRFYRQPKCRMCGSKDCRDCSIPLSMKQTVGEFLQEILDMEVFKENAELEKNEESLRNDDEIHQGENRSYGGYTNLGF